MAMRASAAGIAAATALAVGLAGCATRPTSVPVEVSRFHYDPVASRGTVVVGPLPETTAAPDFATYAAAVQAELVRAGYTPAAPGAKPDNVANLGFTQTLTGQPRRRSGVTIGVGAGGDSGGGGVGVGGGVSFPVGRKGAHQAVATELIVRIRRGPDAIWEGRARTVTDPARPEGTSDAVAQRLASALFAGFPGESGRTIEVP